MDVCGYGQKNCVDDDMYSGGGFCYDNNDGVFFGGVLLDDRQKNSVGDDTGGRVLF